MHGCIIAFVCVTLCAHTYIGVHVLLLSAFVFIFKDTDGVQEMSQIGLN